jgi:hypothetical protein
VKRVLAISFVCAAACNAETPPRGPEDTCAKACETLVENCSASQCARGCNLVLDRLVEHEGGRVLACVSKAGTASDDRAWARCATRIGPHADGGPPAPLPPSDVEPADQE